MKQGDPVFIRASYCPEEGIEEINLRRVRTAEEGTVLWVSKDEMIVPDSCDGNRKDE